MSTRHQTRPVCSYLLRVHEEQSAHLVRRFELLDLASGATLRFATLGALQRHLREDKAAVAAVGALGGKTAATPPR